MFIMRNNQRRIAFLYIAFRGNQDVDILRKFAISKLTKCCLERSMKNRNPLCEI